MCIRDSLESLMRQETSLPTYIKEMIFAYVSGLNGCSYCKNIHAEISKIKLKDIETESFMLDKLAGIAEELERRMAKDTNKGKTVTIKIKYNDFSQQTRSKTVENYVSTKEEFFPIIKDLLFQKSLEKPVRLLGISITKLFNEVNMKEIPVSLQLKFDFSQFS